MTAQIPTDHRLGRARGTRWGGARATHLRKMSQELGVRQGETKWFDISHRIEDIIVEEMTRKGKPIRANVDFYSASTYYMLGIPIDLQGIVHMAHDGNVLCLRFKGAIAENSLQKGGEGKKLR